MKVLVTGSEGFLGKHVCLALDAVGHDVVRMDLHLSSDITMTIPPHEMDAVVHMAAIAAPRTCEADPALAYDVNVNGTHQVIKFAIASEVKKLVFISSAHVYGISPRYMPTDEMHPLHPQETYTTTKILGEKLCELYHDNYGLNYTTLRLFNAYGPGQLPGYFIPDKIQQGMKDRKVELGGGETTKDFVYVDDVVSAVLLALETPYVGAVNIGTGVQTSLNDVAQGIASQLGVDFVGTNLSGGNPTRMMADYGRAKRVLEWEPTVNLQEGLRATIADQAKSVV